MTLHLAQPSEATRAHPLATRSGIALLVEYLAASNDWQGCTPAQRKLLLRCAEPLARAKADAAETSEPVTPPLLPPDAHPRTAAALHRRGLVVSEAGGWRLTPAGAMAADWGAWQRRETA